MKVARRILLAMATLGLSGCVALNRGSLTPTPRPLAEQTLDLDKFIAEHNRNAESIQSLTAKPTISVDGKVMRGRPEGRLALVRPHNFKLELTHSVRTVANIGSNDQEFWFWVQNDVDKSIYWCKYDELDSTPLAVTFQPDWIIEALGLRPISVEEAARIKVREGKERGTTALIFPPNRNGGASTTRMMIVSNQSRRIKEHRIYADNLRSLLAQAEVGSFNEFKLDTSQAGDRRTCYIPESVKLEWKQDIQGQRDQLALDVLLQGVKINEFPPSKTAGLFVEPVISGYERVNLAERTPGQTRDSRTTVRRTLPPPESSNRVKLGRPTSVPDDATVVAPVGSADSRKASRRTTSELEELVKAPISVAPETEAMRAASAAWSANDSSPIGR